MKNLKRVLSMGLASVMLLGMMVMGASAANTTDFTDADKIQNTEAVTTMAALNVINGKDNGSFDPNGNVTRGEMAKMITIMLNGGNEPALSTNAANPKFKDIGGHWAQKYIEYCAAPNQGVVSGRGDGNFDPNGNVTGSEAAKMILTALNYHSDVFNFTGTDWEVNVNSRANAPEANLYDQLKTINPSAPISRDNAAQMLYNALDAKMVTIIYDINNTGTSGKTYRLDGTETFMEAKFGATKVEGVVVANKYANLTGTSENDFDDQPDWTVIDIVDSKNEKYPDGEKAIDVATGLDVLGRRVNIYLRKNTRTGEDEVLGSVVLSSKNTVVTGTAGKSITSLRGKNRTITVHKDNNNQEIGGTYFVNYDGVLSDDTKLDVVPGDTVMLVSNDGKSNTFEYVFVVKYTMDEVQSINTKNETIRFRGVTGNTDFEKIVGEYEDLKKGDYVLTTEVNGWVFIEEPKTVTGELEAYKNGDKNTDFSGKIIGLTVEGDKYDVSWANNKTSNLTDARAEAIKDELDRDQIFYIDANGKIVAMGTPAEVAANYAISWGGADGNVIDAGRVKLTLADGTTKIYTVSEDSNWYMDTANGGESFEWANTNKSEPQDVDTNALGALISYSFDDDGNVLIDLPVTEDTTYHGDASGKEPGDTGYAGDTVTFTKGKTLVSTTNDAAGKVSYATNSSTPFFFVTTRGEGKKDSTVSNPEYVKKVEVFTGYADTRSVGGVMPVGRAELAAKGERAAAVAFIDYVGAGNTFDASHHLYVANVDRTYTGYVTADVYFAGSDELIEGVKLNRNQDIEDLYADQVKNPNKLANEEVKMIYNDGIFLYDEDSNGRYTLRNPETGKDYWFPAQEVGKTSNISVELGDQEGNEQEYYLTDESVIIGIDEDGDPIEAVLGGGVEAGTLIDVLVDPKSEKVLMLAVRGGVAVTSDGTVDSNATMDDVKDLPDGVYAPTGTKYAPDVAGKARENIIVKITNEGETQNFTLTITYKDNGTTKTVNAATQTYEWDKGDHFFYFYIAANNAGEGSFKAVAGREYTATVTDAAGETVCTGSFVAPVTIEKK